MPAEQKQKLLQVNHPQVELREFTDDLMSYLAVADVVVSMGGYNTVCEVLSADKRAVIIPRVKPSQEQILRTTCMAKLGFFQAIEPDQLTAEKLAEAVRSQLEANALSPTLPKIDLNGLPRIAHHLSKLLQDQPSADPRAYAVR
jgi:predicted glycosyltransferase